MSETFQKNGIPATYLGKRKKSAASNATRSFLIFVLPSSLLVLF